MVLSQFKPVTRRDHTITVIQLLFNLEGRILYIGQYYVGLHPGPSTSYQAENKHIHNMYSFP